MKKSTVNPTEQFYAKLEQVGQEFNARLFDSKLPESMFSLRRGVGTLGHFMPNRWRAGVKQSIGEITLNPSLFAECSWLTLFRTIAHQQCHLWQHEYGTASRAGYHNKEWAEQMIRIGLMPSSTGKIDGSITGQIMADYILPNGKFINACVDIIKNEKGFPIQGVYGLEDQVESLCNDLGVGISKSILKKLISPVGALNGDFVVEHKRKIKYACACNSSVWGRSNLKLQCLICDHAFIEAATEAVRI